MRMILIMLRRALLDLMRQPGAALLTVSTVAVVFLLLALFLLAAVNLERLSGELEEGFRLSVFLHDDCQEECQRLLAAELQAMEGVEKIELVDREQARERLRRQLGADAAVLDLVDENPLPAAFEVTPVRRARTLPALQVLGQRAMALAGVEEVIYGQGWLERFFRFRDTLRLVGLLVAGLILLAAAVIVSNTIRLSVLSRREEIEILQLVGASGAFVMVPFYLQGALLGFLGAALGVGMSALIYWLLAPWAQLPLALGQAGAALSFLDWMWLEILLGCGTVLGLLGAAASLWRHLKP